MEPLPGDRIVVRYRLGAGGPDDWRAAPNPSLTHAPSLSDLTGILRERSGDVLVVERDGTAETIPLPAVTSIRRLSTTTIRNSDIRAVEQQLTDSLVVSERASVDGWVACAMPGSDAPRANAAIPLEFGATAGALPAINAWFAERALAARLVIPERLLPRVPGEPFADYEVLVDSDGAVAEALGSDLDLRRSLRAHGYRFHHAVTLTVLSTSR